MRDFLCFNRLTYIHVLINTKWTMRLLNKKERKIHGTLIKKENVGKEIEGKEWRWVWLKYIYYVIWIWNKLYLKEFANIWENNVCYCQWIEESITHNKLKYFIYSCFYPKNRNKGKQQQKNTDCKEFSILNYWLL